MGLLKYVAGGSTLAAIALGLLYLDARDQVAAARAECNEERVTQVLAAERLAAQAEREDLQRQLAAREREVERQKIATQIAEDAAQRADSRPPIVKKIIERVADENACITTLVPGELVDGVFNSEGHP